MCQTATVLVLKTTKRTPADLDGYVFEDAAHAERWLAQAYVKDSEYTAVEVTATRSTRQCGCCCGMHWTMLWRGKRMVVRGAWRPPPSVCAPGVNDDVDDGEE